MVLRALVHKSTLCGLAAAVLLLSSLRVNAAEAAPRAGEVTLSLKDYLDL